MDSFNLQFLISIAIIALGYLLKRTNIVKESDGEGVARIIFNFTLPCLIIVTFQDIVFVPSLFYLIVIGIVYGIVAGFLGLWVFRNNSKDAKGMFGMMIPGLNIGLFAYPLVEGIFGFEGLKYFGMFDVGNSFIVFGLIYIIAGYYSGGMGTLDARSVLFKLTRSIPLQTYIIVSILRLFEISLPSFVTEVSSVISGANMPLSLLLLGIYLNFSFAKGYGKLLMKFLITKYSIGLTLGISAYIFLPMEEMFRFTLLIGFILPTSVSVLPYALMFGYNQRLVGTASNITMIISFFLVWIIVNVTM
ncbi:AEC family transporter [Saliterribacillus persicus]|uniref:Malonate transporter n=1 Tax=Saliterribacillus persicus TaxID=930114 RepID=A0A368XZH0_9BACI|nr:AEC family transporter [Saliterribacillus persicus]RCW71947.1 hypothetical protein DFR57_105131 [Saliterribacillus persicus]